MEKISDYTEDFFVYQQAVSEVLAIINDNEIIAGP